MLESRLYIHPKSKKYCSYTYTWFFVPDIPTRMTIEVETTAAVVVVKTHVVESLSLTNTPSICVKLVLIRFAFLPHTCGCF